MTPMNALRKARLDFLIGWHEGAKKRCQQEAEEHAAAESRLRARYRREFPPMFTHQPADPTRDARCADCRRADGGAAEMTEESASE